MKKSFFLALAFVLTCSLFYAVNRVESRVQGKDVEYVAQGTTMKGFLAYDDSLTGRRPGVLVVPEWWGLNDYARRRAQMLAEMGYTALAVDLYGGGKVTGNPEEAKKLSAEAMKNFDLTKKRFMAAAGFLSSHPAVDPGRLAALGYCFGGGVVLNMARQGAGLRGVASFHGNLDPLTPARSGDVKARILVLTGGDDPFIPPQNIADFIKEMKTARAAYTLIVYSGATHSFTNPDATAVGRRLNMPVAYDARADRESWIETERFLKEIFMP